MILRLSIASLLLSGCALFPYQEADCRGVNWEQHGYRDGHGGHPPQDLVLARQCGQLGIQVPQGDYLKGWAVGHDEHERLKTMNDL